MSSAKSFDLLIEEIRSTGESAQKHFRICLITLALIVSSLGFASKNGGEFLSTIVSRWEFYLGMGFLLSSMILSVLISMHRWGENNWYEFGPPKGIEQDGKPDKTVLVENLKRNQLNLMVSQGFLILSIALIGSSIQEVVNLSGINSILVGVPIIAVILYSTFNIDRKLVSGGNSP